jgi:hypothetical protein
MSESNPNEESITEKIAKIELFQAKSSEAFSMMAKSLSEMNEKLNIVLEILNTFSIMVSEDDEEDYDEDDDEIEDYGDYDDEEGYDNDSTWVPEEKDFWEKDSDDD